jgi:Rps23 Pro-64 3,4-dihydroxylase Tpa1-like proline 4-hydroxylase
MSSVSARSPNLRPMASGFRFHRDELAGLASARHAEYVSAKPFEHIVVDDFLPEAVLDGVLEEFPPAEAEAWISYETENERKLASRRETPIGETTHRLLAELNGAAFVDFLEQLTGIEGLVPDPHLEGGGLHQIVAGGHLNVHVDFDRHPRTGLERRLNVLLYLNRDWKDEYGGALELWSTEPRRCERRILPLSGRLVVFSTTDRSYHGHPEPLACPEGVTRKSLALYYYSLAAEARNGQSSASHNTLFMPLQESRTKRVVRGITPPALVSLGRAARRRQRSQA